MNKLALVVASAILVAGVSGYAVAASTKAPKQIKACAKKKGGALRLAKKCRKSERRITWVQKGVRGATGATGASGASGASGAAGPPGANGTSGTNGTSTGETFFASAGTGFGAGESCATAPSGGPSITFTAPAGSYVQIMTAVEMQRITAGSNGVCLNVDGSNKTVLTSLSLTGETRYLVAGSTPGTTDPLASSAISFPVAAGSHTISLRYTSVGGVSQFTNRNLWVTLFQPTA